MMPRKNRSKLNRRPNLEHLERRDVPATWGIAWPEAQHLTLSFVPDGTSAQGQSSQLFQKLDAQLGAGKWESSILNAFQTWAENSNINIGQVADGGQPLGTAGAAQGDPRFGDIRVSAIPLPSSVAAITAPYDPSTGTFSGDVILNSNDNFSTQSGHDLFTVALHEAGHVYGFADSSDRTSFMYDVYQGPQTTLSSAAISALQGLYGGPRNIAATDAMTVSDDADHPTDITPLIVNSAGPIPISGDLNSTSGANYYQIKAPTATVAPFGVDFQVTTAGISQLIPRITITDENGDVVAGAAASSAADGGVAVHLASFVPGQVYEIRIDGPTADLHSVGSYTMAVSPTALASLINVNTGKATPLPTKATPTVPALTASAQIASGKQVDSYSFTTPSSVVNGVTVRVQAYGIGLVAPQVSVYTPQGMLVGQGSAADPTNPAMTVHLTTALPNTGYVIRVTSGIVNTYQFGTYQVSVSYAAPSATPTTVPIIPTPWLGMASAPLATPNTSLSTAAVLKTPAGYAPGSFYAAMAGIGGTTTAQYYDVKTPKFAQTAYMTITVQTLGASGFLPWVTVSDKAGNSVAAQVLAQSNGVSVLQVPFTSSTDYIIKVAASGMSGANPSGNYYLHTTFGTVASSLGTLASGNLGPAQAGAVVAGTSSSLTTPSAAVYEFVLAGSPANIPTDAILRLTVTDSLGNVMATLATLASEAASLNVILGAGNYSIYVDAFSPSGAALPSLAYQLQGTNLTDPIRIYASSSVGCTTTR